MVVWPPRTATFAAVCPNSLVIETSAPALSNNVTASFRPFIAALCSGVFPRLPQPINVRSGVDQHLHVVERAEPGRQMQQGIVDGPSLIWSAELQA